jgi:hypothetical protein
MERTVGRKEIHKFVGSIIFLHFPIVDVELLSRKIAKPSNSLINVLKINRKSVRRLKTFFN